MKRGRLQILGRIDRYVLALFASSYATALLLVVGLYLIMDMAGNLDEYVQPFPDGTRPSAFTIARFYALHLPFLFLQVAPFVTLVAGLFTVSKLVRHAEAVAALAAGISSQRLLAPIVVVAALIAVSMFGIREFISFELAGKRDALRHLLDKKQLDPVYANLWLRDGRGNVVHLSQYRPRPAGGGPAEIRDFEEHLLQGATWTTTTAPRAVWDEAQDPPRWRLEGGVRHVVVGEGEQRIEATDSVAGFEFTPRLAQTFQRAREKPDELSFAEAAELGSRDPDNVAYRTLLQYHITFPLGNLVLVLVGLPLLLRHERGGGARSLAAAFALCVGYFAADFVCRNLGLQGTLDAPVAAWLPVLFFGSLGIVLYEGMRT
ncbi:MAG: LptF/LptG family permease [Planctomycetota bacterium]|nr:LptF/LptG family permease [Planctomycetota bacterium]